MAWRVAQSRVFDKGSSESLPLFIGVGCRKICMYISSLRDSPFTHGDTCCRSSPRDVPARSASPAIVRLNRAKYNSPNLTPRPPPTPRLDPRCPNSPETGRPSDCQTCEEEMESEWFRRGFCLGLAGVTCDLSRDNGGYLRPQGVRESSLGVAREEQGAVDD